MNYGFAAPSLTSDQLDALTGQRPRLAADVLRLVSLSGSGHPGGSLSTLDALMVIYACAAITPENVNAPDRDRVIISHGHISPGVYATLADRGFFGIDEAYVGFRRAGSVFGGHIEKEVPGVEWNTGNLGQGLSAGAGMAIAGRVRGFSHNVFVGMGDGEQQKGQISEARRFAARFKLSNLIAFIDVNGLQIGGRTDAIMPFDLAASWRADGWNVISADGHDMKALYAAFRAAVTRQTDNPEAPTVLLLDTVMGKGVSSIEGDHKYHGQALTDAQLSAALQELGQDDNIDALRALRRERTCSRPHHIDRDRAIVLDPGKPRTYGANETTDCRSAYGNFLEDIAKANAANPAAWPVIGISCDLEGSVKMGGFRKATPERFFEAGIAEHNAAVVAGAASACGVLPYFSTFGMFGIIECYNQQRLNDQNETAPRVVVTHCGMDVGEDGPTHQCIDYVPAAHNLFGAELYVPADPNETDRILRATATRYAPIFVAMGRSKIPTVTTLDGKPAFGDDFTFEPGVWTQVRPGDDAVVFAVGPMLYRAVQASDQLREQGFGLRVVNASSLKPIDRDCILRCAREVGTLLTYEDHNVHTGLGALVAGVLGDEGVAARLRRLGVSRYGTSGAPDDLFAEQGLAPENLAQAARELAARG